MSSISQRLDLRHSQNLVMTPQLQQAIKLLQLNNVELAEFIEEEIAQNPLLERVETEAKEDGNEPEEASVPSDSGDDIKEEFDQVWTGNEAEAGIIRF
jgi:RNA polymerase sigma-54 factor